ncbi:MAG: class III poly(R)-hydroxyalkanoic acid synthase subunit PhaC [Marinobacterium sp.]|nr:class III poly(R)-hydroxyalkanoic acid synthase subunit PhaC [Marinobacterium sp.]
MNGLTLTATNLQKELATLRQQAEHAQKILQNINEVDVWQTPKTEIYRRDKLRLYHCPAQGLTKQRCNTPLLISYALVNRIYMVDLEPERSLLRRLVEGGLEVYLIDWGYPDRADRFLDLDDYINDYLHSCVEQTCQHAGTEQLNLLGICQGGVFSLCYSALYPQRVRNLITMVTPVDFHTPDNLLTALSRYIDAELAVDCYGNLPGELLNHIYASLMPMRLGQQKYLNLPAQLQTQHSARSFLRMERWINDSPDLAGQAFLEFFVQFFRENRLMNGGTTIGGLSVELQNITQPVLNIYGSHDHLVPPAASRALENLCASQDYKALEIASGHIGVFVSGKSQRQLAPEIIAWLNSRN